MVALLGDVRVRWFRCLLDIRMPHASCPTRCNGCKTVCATRAGRDKRPAIATRLPRCSRLLALPRTSLLPFVLGCRCLRGDSAERYLRPSAQHLPSRKEASPIFQHSSGRLSPLPKLTGLGLPGCPCDHSQGGQTGLLSLYVPSDTRI